LLKFNLAVFYFSVNLFGQSSFVNLSQFWINKNFVIYQWNICFLRLWTSDVFFFRPNGAMRNNPPQRGGEQLIQTIALKGQCIS
jgi:hypothetical protein